MQDMEMYQTQNGIIPFESELKLTSPGMTRRLVASLKRALLDSKRYGLQRLFPARLPPPNMSPTWTLNAASFTSMLAFRYGMMLKGPSEEGKRKGSVCHRECLQMHGKLQQCYWTLCVLLAIKYQTIVST